MDLDLGALEQKETLTQKHVLLSQCTDKNIWVAATAARVLSVWMICPNLTSTQPLIRHGVLIMKRNKHAVDFVMSLESFHLTKESFQM